MSELTPTSPSLATTENADGASVLTRRIYDTVAPFYTISARLFHSQAHRAALAASSIENGARVLEVGMGSGEMFRRLLKTNPDGQTVGVDLSPKMAAHSLTRARRRFPKVSAHCHAADARYLPFETASFDAIVCCYLFELLPREDVLSTLAEVRRVLRPEGRLTVTLVAQKTGAFDRAYRVCSEILPAFWGQQVDRHLLRALPQCGFVLNSSTYVRQIFYTSRVVSAVRVP